MHLTIINGPNLNLLGKREPEVYGKESFDTYLEKLKESFPQITIEYFQSNSEGALIDIIHQKGFSTDGIIINAGGYSHTSIAIHDALTSVAAPAIEVHISNIYARETFRQHSLLSSACKGTIVGLGLTGYELAIRYFCNK